MLPSFRRRCSGSLRTRGLGVVLALALHAIAVPAVHAAHRVVIISLDGLRPDVALRADMPALRSLMARGSFTMHAITTDVAVTLPSHASMLTGVPPARHGITFNGDPKPGQPTAPAWPTLLELAHRAGRSTALCAGKSKFSVLVVPGTLDLSSVPRPRASLTDSEVALTAAGWLRTRRPDVLFVHLPGLDAAGHANGWGSPEQLEAAAATDRALATVLAALAPPGGEDSTLIIVSADHGGAGHSHGGLDERSRFIPWIAVGPGVRAGYDLTLTDSLEVHTEDTFATACDWLRLAPSKPVDGRPVMAIFSR